MFESLRPDHILDQAQSEKVGLFHVRVFWGTPQFFSLVPSAIPKRIPKQAVLLYGFSALENESIRDERLHNAPSVLEKLMSCEQQTPTTHARGIDVSAGKERSTGAASRQPVSPMPL